MPAFDVAGALGAGYSAQEITDYLTANPDQAAGFDVKGAMKAGYSPAEIVDHINPSVARTSAQGTPILGPIQRGIAQTSAQAANLAQDLGFPETASGIRSRIPQADLEAKSSGASLIEDIKAGKYGEALANVPSAALEQFLPVAAGVAGGLVTGGAGPAAATAGRLGGGAAIGAVTQGDAIARQRAANNGEAAPSGTDLALGVAGGAGVGALGSVGLGPAGSGMGAGLRAVASHAASDALQPQAAALAGSIGTNAGAQLASPADSAASALTGAATRGAMTAPSVVRGVAGMAPSAKTAALADQYASLSPDDQAHTQNLVAANDALTRAQANAVPMPNESRPSAVARGAAKDIQNGANSLVESLDNAGVLPDGGADTIKGVFATAKNQQDVLGKDDLAKIDGLGLDTDTSTKLKNAAIQLQMLSDAGVANRGASALGGLGNTLGRVAGFTYGGLLTGHPFLAAEAGGYLGKSIGDFTAARLGMTKPQLVKQADNASTMLAAAGVKVPNTLDGLSAAIQGSNDAITAQARLMGLDPAKALSAGLDSALSDKIALDRQGAVQAMNADFAQRGGVQAQETTQGRTQMLQDMKAAPDLMAQDFAQRGGAQAQETTQGRTQMLQDMKAAPGIMAQDFAARGAPQAQETTLAERQADFQRSQDVSNATVMMKQDLTQRGGVQAQETTLAARSANPAVNAAIQRAAAQRAAPPAAAPADAAGPLSPQGIATARAIAANPDGPTATQAALSSLSQPMPGIEGLSKPALVQGKLLPDWQYGIGTDVMKALQLRGMPKNLSPAQVSEAAVRSLQGNGAFSKEFGDALMAHSGRVTRGLYNSIRNEALMAHGVDMRTIEAQQSSAAPMAMAAE